MLFLLLQKLRDLEGTKRTACAEDRVKVLASGFQTHITKPFEPAQPVTVVAHLDRRKRPL